MPFTASAWASAPTVSPKTRQVVEALFFYADTKGPEAAASFAALFAPEGVIRKGTAEVTGDAIGPSRAAAWRGWAARKHEIYKVYTASTGDDASTADVDVVLLGNIAVRSEIGKEATTGLAARVVVRETDGLIVRYEIWGDMSALLPALVG